MSGTYRIDEVIGEGAYGVVYAATHARLQKRMAVKVLRVHDDDAFQRFRREAEIAGNLGSRFIVEVFDFNTLEDGAPYLVMELLNGEDLGTRLKKQSRLQPKQALQLCEQVAMALSVAHRHQIVHRDLKPQNIFLCTTEDEGEVVKVIDFGISKVLTQVGTTAAGQFIGTPLYMSPEQVRGDQAVIDGRSDIYALAAVLYEALTGQPVYPGATIFELVQQISGPAEPKKPSSLNSAVPSKVDDIILRALSVDPGKRPSSVLAFYNELANAIRGAIKDEAATPAAAIMGTHAMETAYATGMVATPLWRGRVGTPDELRFAAPDGGFFGDDQRARVLPLAREDGDQRDFLIGSVPSIGELQNDLVLPHRKVSRNAVRVVLRDGRVYLRRESKCSVPVRVGLSLLERGEERPLHHGQTVAIGVVGGSFHDGRYVPAQVPAQSVDERTGLLGREGLAWEVALAAKLDEDKRLVLCAGVGDGANQELACALALRIHHAEPKCAVARFRHYAAVLVPRDIELQALYERVRADEAFLMGYHAIGGASDEAAARIDEAIGALARLSSAGKEQGVLDLAPHQLNECAGDEFLRRARDMAERGGGTGLLALEENQQIQELGAAVATALELELLQVAGKHAGSRAVLARPVPATVAFACPDDPGVILRAIAAEWHERGPVRGDVLEVERSVATEVIEVDGLGDLHERAKALVSGGGLSAGIEGMPLPIANAVRGAVQATTPQERARSLVRIVDDAWHFLGVVLTSMAAAAGKSIPIPQAGNGDAGIWRAMVYACAESVGEIPGRVGELVASLFDAGRSRQVLDKAGDAADRVRSLLADSLAMSPSASQVSSGSAEALPQLESAVHALLLAMRPLRGWTLISVSRVDRVDIFGDCESVHYYDYTGTYARGTQRQATLIKDLRMGPFVYLTRLAEGIVVPLEPHLRRRPCAQAGGEELFWAQSPVRAPGEHSFVSVVDGQPLVDVVTSKQIPRFLRDA